MLDYIRSLFLGSWQHYALAFVAIVFAVSLRGLASDWLLGKLKVLSEGTESELDDRLLDAFERPLRLGLFALGVMLAAYALELRFGTPARMAITPKVASIVLKVVSVTWFIVFGWLALNLCDVAGHYLELLTGKTETKLDDMLVPIVRRSLKIFVGMIVFMLIVQSLGYSIAALLAGFSVGGIAFALAAKDTLENFFGSVMIFVDRPFQVGDWVLVGKIEGTVEEVGFRSTRIRTFAKTLITVPNSKVAHEAINNYSQMPKRRVVQDIGVGYDTDAKRVEAAVNAFRQILHDDERVDQDFWMVNFNNFGDSGLNIYIYYFTSSTVWAEYMQTRQEINLRFMLALEKLGVEIVFPTQTLYMRQDQPLEKPPLEAAMKVLCPQGFSPPVPSGAAGDEDDDNDDG